MRILLALYFITCLSIISEKPAYAQVLHEYYFNKSFVGSNGGPALTEDLACGATKGSFRIDTIVTNAGPCIIDTAFAFRKGGGVAYANPSYITNSFTINIFFKFDAIGSWSRIIDFSNSIEDAGIYLQDACLNFFPNGDVGICPYFSAGKYYLITVVRDGSTGIISVYVNGSVFGTYNDNTTNKYRCATNTTPIIFFRDDEAVSCEAKSGLVKYISVTSEVLSSAAIADIWKNICSIILVPCGGKGNSLPRFVSPAADTTIHITEGASLNMPLKTLIKPITDSITLSYDLSQFPANKPQVSGVSAAIGSTDQIVSWQSDCGQARSSPYDIKIKAQGPCPIFNNALTIHVIVDPLQPVTISRIGANDTLCPGTNVSLSVTGQTNAVEWYSLSNPTFLLGSSNPLNISPSITTTYFVKAPAGNNCAAYDTFVVAVAKQPFTLINTPGDSICRGETAILVASGAISYEWGTLSDPATILSTQYIYSYTANTGTTFILKGTDITGCVAYDTAQVEVLAPPLLTISESTKSYTCFGDTNSITAHGAKSYTWYSIPGLKIVSYDSVLITNPSLTTTYLVVASNQHSCTASANGVFIVRPTPALAISGPSQVCPGSREVLYTDTLVVPGSADTYVWSVQNGTLNNGLSADTVHVDWQNISTQTYISAIKKNAAGCSDTVVFPVTLSSQALIAAPKGPSIICSDATPAVYSVPFPSSSSTYQWSISGGKALGDSTGSTVSIKWFQAGNSEIYYTEIAAGLSSCTFISQKLPVTINQSPIAMLISGQKSVCHGDQNSSYALYGLPNSTYQWQITPSGGSFSSAINTSEVFVSWNTEGTYTLQVIETSGNGCMGDTRTLQVVVNPLPISTPVDGNTVVCHKDYKNQLYTIPEPYNNNTSRFIWTVENGHIIRGQNTPTVSINWNGSGNGSVSVYQITKDSCIGPVKQITVLIDNSEAHIIQVGTQEEDDSLVDIKWPAIHVAQQLAEFTLSRKTIDPQSRLVLDSSAALYVGTSPRYTDKAANTDRYIYEYRYQYQNACEKTESSAIQNTIHLVCTGNEEKDLVHLSWNPYVNWSNDVFSYQVYRKIDADKEFSYYTDAGTDTSITLSDAAAGFYHSYRVKAVEKNSSASSWSNEQSLVFKYEIMIPNTFTPNGDGKNDAWVLRRLEAYSDVHLEIYNRWGQKVYEDKNYQNNWKGTTEAGKDLPDGSYYYFISTKNAMPPGTYSGWVLILR